MVDDSMTTTLTILGRYKESMKKKFLDLVHREPHVPLGLAVPLDPEEALQMGIQMGRQEGYGEGLLDGAQLGLDVGQDVMETVLCQQVIFGSTSELS